MRFMLTLVAASALLVACGGSDDNDVQDPQTPPSTNPSTPTNPGTPANPGTPGNPAGLQGPLSSANYVPVAQAALVSNNYLLNASNMFVGAEVSDSNVLVKFTQNQIRQLPRRMAAPVQAVGAVEIDEERCDNGGKIIYEINDVNNNGRDDRGDYALLKAQNCAMGSVVFNGQVRLTLDNVNGDTESFPFSVTATALYSDLSATVAGVTVIGNGSMRYTESSQSEYSHDVRLNASSFSLRTVVDGVSFEQTLQNYDLSVTERPLNSGGQVYTSSVNGTMINSAFGPQLFTVKTTQPFVRLSSDAYASQGELLVTDKTPAKVRARVANATTVAIELDADGNGSYETSVNKPWSEML